MTCLMYEVRLKPDPLISQTEIHSKPTSVLTKTNFSHYTQTDRLKKNLTLSASLL